MDNISEDLLWLTYDFFFQALKEKLETEIGVTKKWYSYGPSKVGVLY